MHNIKKEGLMPYIEQKKRKRLDFVVYTMDRSAVKPDGELSYVLFRHCAHTIVPSYKNYKAYITELKECAEELSRRFLAQYADSAIEDRGDVQ